MRLASIILSFMSQRIVITGATGFIAGHTIVQLIRQGYQVCGTLRNPSNAEPLRERLQRYDPQADWQQLELVTADLNHDLGWEVVAGCDAVLHMASPFPASMPADPDELITPAREGTLRVLQACEAYEVNRVILTSSVAAVGYPAKPRSATFTEQDWSSPVISAGTNAYTCSKTIAEQAAWEFVQHAASPLRLTTINPGLVIGPVMDSSQSTSVNLIKDIVNGDLPLILPFGVSLVDVRDVARAHLLALQQDETVGRRYICVKQFLWMAAIVEHLQKQYPQYAERMPKRHLPLWLAKSLALVNKDLKDAVHELGVQRVYGSNRLLTLGWQPVDIQQSLVDTVSALETYHDIKPADAQLATTPG